MFSFFKKKKNQLFCKEKSPIYLRDDEGYIILCNYLGFLQNLESFLSLWRHSGDDEILDVIEEDIVSQIIDVRMYLKKAKEMGNFD